MMAEPARIVVAVCTFQRNEPLRTLLSALLTVAGATGEQAQVGVVVVDDNLDGRARSIVHEFEGQFSLGCLYRYSGQQNISMARNMAVDTAIGRADWVAMVDDDCEPEPGWLCEFLSVLNATEADCAAGPMHLRVPVGSPRWLSEQPFFDDVRLDMQDGAIMKTGATNNSIIRAAFLRDHPNIRFDPALGKLGGEDMVFFRRAFEAGLSIRFARFAGVWGNEAPERATFRHQVRYRFWLGNTEYITNSYFGETRCHMFLRGIKRLVIALARPARRLLQAQQPNFRYCVASMAGAIGLICGTLGFKNDHPQDKA